jgi:hypothetical protein
VSKEEEASNLEKHEDRIRLPKEAPEHLRAMIAEFCVPMARFVFSAGDD